MASVDKAFVFVSIAIVAVAVGFALVQSSIDQSSQILIGGPDQQSKFAVGGVAQQEVPGVLEEASISVDPPQIKPIRSASQVQTVLVEGKVVDYNRGQKIFLYVERPDGEFDEYGVLGTKSGEFSLTVGISSDYNVEDEYQITVNYPNKKDAAASTKLVVTSNPSIQAASSSSKIANQCELGKSRCELCIESTTGEQFTCTRDFREESCGGTKVCNITAPVPLPSELMPSKSSTSQPSSTKTLRATEPQCRIGEPGCDICVDPATPGGFPCTQAHRDQYCDEKTDCEAPASSEQSVVSSPVRDIKEFSISTKRVIVTEGQKTEFTVTGHIPNLSSSIPVELELFFPDATSRIFDVQTDSNGDFELKLNFDITDMQGKHMVRGKTSRIGLGEQFFFVEHQFAESKEKEVPSWIKTNVQWWTEGTVPDSEFLKGIEFMMKENIIDIPNLPEPSSEVVQKEIPDWVRNNAKWWTDGLLSDPEFISSLEFLVQEGVISP